LYIRDKHRGLMMLDKKLGTVVTSFLKLKQKIKKKNAEIDDLKEKASGLEKQIIKAQEREGIERSDVALGSATIKETTVHSVKDWKKVYKYIFSNKDQSILQKRLSQATLNEYLEDGARVPGTEKMIKKSLMVGFKRRV